MNNSANKVVVITGASSGIGEAIALHLANNAFSLVLVARRQEKINALVDRIIQQGGKAIAVKADVTRQEEVQRAIEAAIAAYQRVDVLINNAGFMAIAPLSELKTEEWDKMIDTNLKGVLYGIAAALPVFQRQGSGHFINVASVAGIKVLAPGGVVYSATKFAVRALSEGLRQEAGKTIRTTLISPGAVESELQFGSSDEESKKFLHEFYKQAISADAIARSVLFAIEQPGDVDINEIVVRPTQEEF
ncbi:SDR family NAD(P)-dependent oxidoreductase [Enterobacter cloacae]|uniref:SDR family NAD(P)-dependent oxidoreductase n=1 Tax=Enterobacter cloacae TaxID=550 RepID=A0A2T4XZ07_ENTCL|nr:MULTISPECIES: SDR family oxidoreductase [Enterobacter cloacae complex]HDT2078557.1 SDR family oxidoreductase [Enterobacter roggenkampii]HEG2002243.1 SDR family oxidoreductase [Enterobacter asburiae]MCD2457395.1 SDR family oxidoreductase [Enterobacter cloacae complex sp. 2021EL-01261]MDT9876819.1 SDR family oxidoreductase [Enterobacter cloacae]PTM35167.1 SDR family NAD(P)-dependent oxidoreductase [Enterobacter cloacae]